MLSRQITHIGLGLVAWATLLAATLSIANLPGNWGHAICGPWGCGPPLQALLACHLAWFAVLVPLAMVIRQSSHISAKRCSSLGKLLCIAGLLYLLATVIYQFATWYPVVGTWQRAYFWQRCGFVIATTVDVPVLQTLVAGIYLQLLRRPPTTA